MTITATIIGAVRVFTKQNVIATRIVIVMVMITFILIHICTILTMAITVTLMRK